MGDKFNDFVRSGIKSIEITGDQPDLPRKILASANTARPTLPAAGSQSGAAITIPVRKL